MNSRPGIMTVRATVAVAVVVLMGTLPAAGQDGSSPGPLPSCGAADAASPCASPAAGAFSGTMTWSEVSDDPGGLGSGENWVATVDLLMGPDANGGLVALGGSYTYTDEFTGHCTGTGSGSGTISTELYAFAELGVGAASASTLADGAGDLVFDITIQPEEFLTDCAASGSFDAFQAPAGYSPRSPYCTGVYLAYDPGPPVTYTFSCLEQDVPGLHVAVDGVLAQGLSD